MSQPTEPVDPAVKPLLVRREMWKYYPRIIYDIGFAPWLYALLWAARPESREGQEAMRADVARLFLPKAPERVVTTLSLRTFFDCLIKGLGLQPGDEIVFSGISIPHMVQIVDHHKLVPRAFDIDLPTFEPNVEQAKACFNSRTKLLVLAPVFGRPMRRMKELLQFAKGRGVTTMIDAAQCFAIREELLQYDADVHCFSFGSIKFSTALGGSINVVKDAGLRDRVAAEEARLPVRSLGKHYATVAKNGFIMLTDDPLSFGIFRVALEAMGMHIGEVVNAMSRGFPGDQLMYQIRHRPRVSHVQLLRHRMMHIDEKAARVRCISGWHMLSQMPNYMQVASGGDPDFPEKSSFWLFPINVKVPKVVADIFQAHGFDAALGTSQMRSVGDVTSCPQCFQFMSNVVYIPIYPEMNEDARERFVKMVHAIPRKYLESPSARFHEYVASRREKHAYRSAAVTRLLRDRPKFTEPVSSLLAAFCTPVLTSMVLSKL